MTDRFLQAEEQATRLVEKLEQLQREIDAHTEAANSLENARSSMEDLTRALLDTAQELKSTTKALREIGTPVILDELARSRKEAWLQAGVLFIAFAVLLLVIVR